MAPHFIFQVDPTTNLISVSMSGFFSVEDVAAFGAARTEAHSKLSCGPNQHLTLIDMRSMQIQSQESVAAFGAVMHSPEHYSRKIAIVVSKSLARLQIQRAARDRHIEYFADDVDAARRWLLQPEMVAA